MIIKCGYKHNDYCKCYDKKIEDVEKERKEKCCISCNQAIEIYTDVDKVKVLYDLFKLANKEKSAYKVSYMYGIYGHCSSLEDDLDSLGCKAYKLWLILHKKYKFMDHLDILDSYNYMRLIKMKVPKRIKRKVRRIRKHYKNLG